MQIIQNPLKKDWSTILERPTKTVDDIEAIVNTVFNDIKNNGDKALNEYTHRYDKVELESVIVSEIEINDASNTVSKELKEAIQLAKSNIEKFHSAQKTEKVPKKDTAQKKDMVRKKDNRENINTVVAAAITIATIIIIAIPITPITPITINGIGTLILSIEPPFITRFIFFKPLAILFKFFILSFLILLNINLILILY